ncbi:MAG: response regulator transcription factor [Thermomicrobiales bacterium]
MTDPFRLETEGKYLEAADLWHVLGHPVQEARARAATGDVDQLRSALQMLQSIDARADAARVSKQLRQSGVSSVPKGPRERTRENPAQLTDREMDVLRLLATGKTNREIGEALFISPRTCGHHVSAILSKLGVQSRSDAVAAARSLGFEK